MCVTLSSSAAARVAQLGTAQQTLFRFPSAAAAAAAAEAAAVGRVYRVQPGLMSARARPTLSPCTCHHGCCLCAHRSHRPRCRRWRRPHACCPRHAAGGRRGAVRCRCAHRRCKHRGGQPSAHRRCSHWHLCLHTRAPLSCRRPTHPSCQSQCRCYCCCWHWCLRLCCRCCCCWRGASASPSISTVCARGRRLQKH